MLVIPFFAIERNYRDITLFLTELARFTHERNAAFVEKFLELDAEPKQGQQSLIDLLELKPNFCGIGLNLNELFKRLRKASHRVLDSGGQRWLIDEDAVHP
ncbi:MAG: hypothetical protein JWN43_2254, partial [Gammaproteobacteria bacterium]|nr:hypothetical protein [Gammaproteobacteria bacterium]